MISTGMVYLFWGVVGALVGSFLNAFIHRQCHNEATGEHQTMLHPKRSYCPHCQATIAGYDNIPLISFLILRAKCRSCRAPISIRYFIVEVLALILTIGMYHLFYELRGDTFGFAVALYLSYALLAITFIDLDVMIIPNEVTYSGMILGLIWGAAVPQWHGATTHLSGFLAALLGLVVVGGCLYLIGFLGSLAFKKDAMGGGDVKLLAMIGAFLGWSSFGLIIFAASLLGTVCAVVMMLCGKKEMGDAIPFGPFLAAASLIALCWQDQIYHLWLGV